MKRGSPSTQPIKGANRGPGGGVKAHWGVSSIPTPHQMTGQKQLRGGQRAQRRHSNSRGTCLHLGVRESPFPLPSPPPCSCLHHQEPSGQEARGAWEEGGPGPQPQGEKKVVPRAPLSSQGQDCLGVQPTPLKPPTPQGAGQVLTLPSRCAHICLPATSHSPTAVVQPACTSLCSCPEHWEHCGPDTEVLSPASSPGAGPSPAGPLAQTIFGARFLYGPPSPTVLVGREAGPWSQMSPSPKTWDEQLSPEAGVTVTVPIVEYTWEEGFDPSLAQRRSRSLHSRQHLQSLGRWPPCYPVSTWTAGLSFQKPLAFLRAVSRALSFDFPSEVSGPHWECECRPQSS